MDEKMKEAFKGIYDNLTDEQKEKAKADEMMALAGEWGVELPDQLLDSVAGGTIKLGGGYDHGWCDDGRSCNNSYCYDCIVDC